MKRQTNRLDVKAKGFKRKPSLPSPKVIPSLRRRSRTRQVTLVEPSPVASPTPAPEVPREVKPALNLDTPAPAHFGYDENSAFNLYLNEIGQTSLLTIEEENALAARIQLGDEEARQEMIKANLRLVVKIAREYEGYGLPLLDLINEGNIGLIKAVERFDPAKGAKLSTYSAWWIKQSIKRALANQSKTIRLPVHIVDKIFHIRRASLRLREEFGREPTDEEIAEEMEMSVARVVQLRSAAIRPASLESPLGDDDSSRLADVVEDENADTPYEQLEEKNNAHLIQELMGTLNPREASILRYRYGLDGDSEKTLEEVGRHFGVTRERIRQLQNIALSKLRKKIEELETSKTAA